MKTLNDFPGIGQPGNIEIWYYKDNFNTLKPEMVDPDNLESTHVFMGKVSIENKEDIFRALQGENYSPDGEANEFIESKGISHTSMSVGDVIKFPDGLVYVCNWAGWLEYNISGPIFKNITVRLTGKNGNAFGIIGAVKEEMRKNKVSNQIINNFSRKAMSGDYDNLLRVCMKYVNVT